MKVRVGLLLSMISVFVVSSALVGCVGGKSAFDSIEQSVTKIELGESIDLIDCITFDSTQIKAVSVSDKGGFNKDKVGEYAITYTATNLKDKSQDIQYTVIVHDTVSPSLQIDEEKIYLRVGEELEIANYVKAIDKSGTQKIKYDGEIDCNIPGEYSIVVYAEDESGNVSERKSIGVMVEDRICDVRNAKFGDSHEVVERYEEEKGGVYSEGKITNTLRYETTAAGVKVMLVYCFNKNDELFAVAYVILDKHTNYNEYVNDFKKVDQNLEEKYGKPDVQETFTGRLYNYCNDNGEALQLGELAFNTEWDLENMNIYHHIQNDNGIQHSFNYVSKEYQETEDHSSY